MTAPAISFDATDEDYCFVAGRGRVRRWHKVARDAGLVPEFPDAAYQALVNAKHRGRQVDEATQLIMRGDPFDVRALAEESLPYVQVFLAWWQQNRPVFAFDVQRPFYNEYLDYCTTPDFCTAACVYDIKTSSQRSRLWGLQLAAQALAHGAADRCVVWLRPRLKGPRVHELRDDDYSKIYSRFDYDVVREACRGEYDGPAITAWKARR